MKSIKDFSEMTIKLKETKKDKGIFVIGPVPKGYGYTLGNSLRRVLLSSLEGASVTSVKIHGVEHEYTAISGVLEDVVEIILRIKSLKIISHTEEPQRITLSVKGKTEATSADIKTTADVEIVDKNLLIATLTDPKASLEIEMIVEKGIGYKVANEDLRVEAGVLPVDADFSPVKRVKLEVDPTRVGARTDFENLTISIFTDGLIKPEDAMSKGADILRKIYGFISVLGGIEQMEKLDEVADTEAKAFLEEKAAKADAEEAMEDDLVLSGDWDVAQISETNFPTRVKGALMEAGINTVGELTKHSREEIKEIPGLGEKSLQDLESELKKMGLVLLD